MKFLKDIINIYKFNIKTMMVFELISKVLISLVFTPIALYGFNLTMKITKYSYITQENIFSFATNPLTIFLILLIIIFLTIVTLFDISAMLIIYDASYHQKKIRAIDVIRISLERMKPLLKIRNISVAFLLLFLIPFFNMGVSSNVISSINIPEFILEYIDGSNALSSLLFTIYVILVSMLINWIFSIHYMILEGKDFKDARKQSHRLIKGKQLKDILLVVAAQFIVATIYTVFITVGLIIIFGINAIFSGHLIIESMFITFVGIFIVIMLIIFAILSNTVNYAVISCLYYKHKVLMCEKIYKLDYKEKCDKTIKGFNVKRAIVCLIVIAMVGGTILTYQIISGKANINIEQMKTTEITAHRGACEEFPENTMGAFKRAKELGADWIELDVQQTKDNKIVVYHDSNLKRLTRIDRYIKDMTYDELMEINIENNYKSEKIPLLEDVVKFASTNGIRLNIEIKPTDKDEDIEKHVIDIVDAHGFTEMCVITSQKYYVLENVKKINSNIKTVYVTSIAIGKITELRYADCYSVEATSITDNLVSRVHNDGKEIYAWTTNSEETISKMIDLNVDNIITDDVELGRKIVAKKKQGSMVTEIIDVLQSNLIM